MPRRHKDKKWEKRVNVIIAEIEQVSRVALLQNMTPNRCHEYRQVVERMLDNIFMNEVCWRSDKEHRK